MRGAVPESQGPGGAGDICVDLRAVPEGGQASKHGHVERLQQHIAAHASHPREPAPDEIEQVGARYRGPDAEPDVRWQTPQQAPGHFMCARPWQAGYGIGPAAVGYAVRVHRPRRIKYREEDIQGRRKHSPNKHFPIEAQHACAPPWLDHGSIPQVDEYGAAEKLCAAENGKVRVRI